MRDYVIIGVIQAAIWFAAGYGYLLTQVDRSGRYISIPLMMLYVVLAFGLILCVPILYRRESISIKSLSRCCSSPGIIAFAVLVLSGNMTPWVLAEPVMLAGVGNISLFPGNKWIEDNRLDLVKTEVRSNDVVFDQAGGIAVIAIGGVGGGFDSPAKDLYSKLSDKLKSKKVLMLDVKLRQPGSFDESMIDVKSAIQEAHSRGANKTLLLGHSFGGGVVIATALNEPSVLSAVALSSQTTGSEHVDQLSPKSLLLVHGIFDYINPRFCGEDIYRRANSPKALHLVAATHLLDEAADQTLQIVEAHIDKTISAQTTASR